MDLKTIKIKGQEYAQVTERITDRQRRYIFVLVRNYADLTKYTPEEAREILTIIYCHQNRVPSFSLSDCSLERASDFIEFILKYTEEWRKNIYSSTG